MIARILSVLMIFAGIAILIFYPQLSDHKSETDLELLNLIKGERAVEMVRSIHLGEFDIQSAVVAEFKGIGNIRVWIAYADSDQTAKDLVERMRGKVHMFFSEPETIEIESLKTYRVFGDNKVHYFFSHQNKIVWIEFDNPDAKYHRDVVKYLFLENGMEKYIN